MSEKEMTPITVPVNIKLDTSEVDEFMRDGLLSTQETLKVLKEIRDAIRAFPFAQESSGEKKKWPAGDE